MDGAGLAALHLIALALFFTRATAFQLFELVSTCVIWIAVARELRRPAPRALFRQARTGVLASEQQRPAG